MVKITTEPIDTQKVIAAVEHPEAGGICTFLGVVRNHNQGRRVWYLEYEAYPEMAEAVMRQIADEIGERWPGAHLAMAHRIGRLEIGEPSVVIAVATPHRTEAFEACRYAIDRLKAIVPIWKKEVWEGGEYWIEGATVPESLRSSMAR